MSAETKLPSREAEQAAKDFYYEEIDPDFEGDGGLVRANLASLLDAFAAARTAEILARVEKYDVKLTVIRTHLSAAGVPEAEEYPDDPTLGAWEKSLRTGGRCLSTVERIERLVAARVAAAVTAERQRCIDAVWAEGIALGDLRDSHAAIMVDARLFINAICRGAK